MSPEDLWGYYNASASGGPVPTLYFNSAASHGERFRITDKDKNGAVLAGYSALPGGHDRSVNASTVYFGSLKRINYPTGGYAQINYEPATYYDSVAQTNISGPGIRVSSIVISDSDGDPGNDIVSNYTYTKNQRSSGILLYPPSFAFADGPSVVRTAENLAPSDELLYEQVSVSRPGQGKSVYRFLVPGRYPETAFSDWTTPLTKISKDQSCSPIGNLVTGYYTYPFAPPVNYDFERGLLLKTSVWKEGGTYPLTEKSYTYARVGGGGTGVLVKAFRFERVNQSLTYVVNEYK
ncbi:MAG TPA: hypothetical protein VEB86_07565, partial [Chryseosolibacter sp.]|nr:hypothetical protein [Chryseosolibacter sp.]